MCHSNRSQQSHITVPLCVFVRLQLRSRVPQGCIIAGEHCRIRSMWPINWPLVATTNYDPPARTGHQATFKKDRHRFPQDCHIAASLPAAQAFSKTLWLWQARRGFQQGFTNLRAEDSARSELEHAERTHIQHALAADLWPLLL